MSEKRIIYDNEFKVISTDKLNVLNNQFVEYTKRSLEIYKDLFKVEKLHKLEFTIFDDLEEYRDICRKERKIEPPPYSRGCFGANKVYMVIEQPIIPGTEYFYQKRASGAHEAFHIYYRDLVYKNPKNRIVWFDEGMAQFFSKERAYTNDDKFAKYYSKFRNGYKPITNLNERIQGNTQVPDDKIFSRKGIIDGYAISYLAISYLAETKGIDYIKETMRDNKKILQLGNTIASEMIKYYDEKMKENEIELF